MKSSNRYSLLTALVILCLGVAVSASILRLPALRQSAAPAQVQLAPAPGGNDASDDPANANRSVTLRTDKTEYARGEVVIITGSGWDPGEAVTLVLHEEPAIHADRAVTAIADADGNIFDNQFTQDAHNVRLFVTATGRNTGLSTQAAFGNPAASINQCADGTFSSPVQCTGANWQNGDLNSNNSHYREGNAVPFQVLLSNLPLTSHTLVIQWQTTKSGKHAYDYLTNYYLTEANANPCSGTTLHSGNCAGLPGDSQTLIPLDPNITGAVPPMLPGRSQLTPQYFSCFGCTFPSLGATSSYTLTGPYSGDSTTTIALTFTANVAAPVIAWGGHVASGLDWGPGTSASAISGSPYHMALVTLDGASAGSQNRAIKAGAVLPEPNIATSVSPAQLTLGASVTDGITVTGDSTHGLPSGTASFYECGPFTSATPCTFLDSTVQKVGSDVTLSGTGFVTTATSAQFTPSQAGTFCFMVVYNAALTADYSSEISSSTTNECVTVKNGPTIATTLSESSGAIGDTVHDSAALTGATASAGGTVTYTVYTNNLCTLGARDAGTKTVTNHIVPDSNGLQFNSAGTFYWQAVYSGDANNGGATSTCTSEQLVIGKNSPSIGTTLSATSVSIGSQVHDSASLTGATANAGGSATYTVYTDNACSLNGQSAGTKTVSGGVVPDSDAVTFNSAGDFYWQVVYSGDANNNGATSPCNEHLVVNRNSPSIGTTLSESSGKIGDTVHDSSALTGATSNAGGTVVYSVYSDSACSSLFASAGTKTVSAGAVPDSDGVQFNQAATYYWQAVYSGDANNNGATSLCTSEQLVIGKNSPTESTAQTLLPNDSFKLDGGSNPTGTITFTLFGPDNTTCDPADAVHPPRFTQTVPVNNGNHTYSTTNGNGCPSNLDLCVFATDEGTWRWLVVYSGDDNNEGVTSACGVEKFTITNQGQAGSIVATQLLAAHLKWAASGEACPAAVSAINDARELLAAIHFNGETEDKMTATQSKQAGDLAAVLRRYNTNELCK